jgi:hypothetical protein
MCENEDSKFEEIPLFTANEGHEEESSNNFLKPGTYKVSKT